MGITKDLSFFRTTKKTTQLAPLKNPSTIELKNHNKNKYEEKEMNEEEEEEAKEFSRMNKNTIKK